MHPLEQYTLLHTEGVYTYGCGFSRRWYTVAQPTQMDIAIWHDKIYLIPFDLSTYPYDDDLLGPFETAEKAAEAAEMLAAMT